MKKYRARDAYMTKFWFGKQVDLTSGTEPYPYEGTKPLSLSQFFDENMILHLSPSYISNLKGTVAACAVARLGESAIPSLVSNHLLYESLLRGGSPNFFEPQRTWDDSEQAPDELADKPTYYTSKQVGEGSFFFSLFFFCLVPDAFGSIFHVITSFLLQPGGSTSWWKKSYTLPPYEG